MLIAPMSAVPRVRTFELPRHQELENISGGRIRLPLPLHHASPGRGVLYRDVLPTSCTHVSRVVPFLPSHNDRIYREVRIETAPSARESCACASRSRLLVATVCQHSRPSSRRAIRCT